MYNKKIRREEEMYMDKRMVLATGAMLITAGVLIPNVKKAKDKIYNDTGKGGKK